METTRRYIADSVAEGLLSVREELGADAMIVSVKEDPANQNGKVQIIAKASTPVAQPAVESEIQSMGSALLGKAAEKAQAFVPPVVTPAATQTATNNQKATRTPSSLNHPNTRVKTPPTPQTRIVKPAQKKTKLSNLSTREKALLSKLYASQGKTAENSAPISHAEETVKHINKIYNSRSEDSTTSQTESGKHVNEMKEIGLEYQRHIEQPLKVSQFSIPSTAPVLPPEAASLYFYLMETGIEENIAEEMVLRLCDKMNPKHGWDRTKVQQFLNAMVNKQIRTGGVLRKIKKKRTVALIGPTGVGKTTTIAKLATKMVRNNVSVGLITIDHFRVGAVDQLKKFAQTMNVPLLAASNQRDFNTAMRAFHSRQVVLIDTAGQNPRDLDLLDRLNQTLRSAGNVERHLVLSAPTKERDLNAFIDLYHSIDFDYLLFSKLDETTTYGGLLNSYFAADRPFSYFTTGQQVPEDIEEASSQRLTELLFH